MNKGEYINLSNILALYCSLLKTKAPKEGFEPSTSSLGGKRSIQAELLGHITLEAISKERLL